MIIEPEFIPVVGNGDFALKIATLRNNEYLKEVKSENKNREVFLLRKFLHMPFTSPEKFLNNLTNIKVY